MSKSSILYLSDDEDETLGALGEEDETLCEEKESPFKNGDEIKEEIAEKCYSVVKPKIKEKSSVSTYKKNPLGTSRRDLVGKFEKELQCQYCERPYRQRHHLLAHESKTCPVVLQMARDKLMNQVTTTTTAKDEEKEEEEETLLEPIGKVVVLNGETKKKKKAFNPPPPPAPYPRQREKRKKEFIYKELPESSEEDEPEQIVIKPKFKFAGR